MHKYNKDIGIYEYILYKDLIETFQLCMPYGHFF